MVAANTDGSSRPVSLRTRAGTAQTSPTVKLVLPSDMYRVSSPAWICLLLGTEPATLNNVAKLEASTKEVEMLHVVQNQETQYRMTRSKGNERTSVVCPHVVLIFYCKV
ncbi:uncharacterized protein LOC123428773 isoform X1 [Hordeum vulgare subsp. vulgare]|uniref:uncharacterized protein LOC123428773 isoform X1 n=1 Tax=Hordeum vulgare subsp. vulgare TaxID=112509 RepID=UPI001D1A5697|nr:uncharacterized protein LOC123428773 isoform X1 [Hordeum vulgare subsp. vulgare]